MVTVKIRCRGSFEQLMELANRRPRLNGSDRDHVYFDFTHRDEADLFANQVNVCTSNKAEVLPGDKPWQV